MASDTGSEFAIVEKLGVERLWLLLKITAELANYTAGESVSVMDLALDDRVADEEIGKTRVRDSLVLFQTLGLIQLDDTMKIMQPDQRLIGWTQAESGLEQFREFLTADHAQSEPNQPATTIVSDPTSENPEPTPRPGSARFGRGVGRQPIRVASQAKSDEALMAELEATNTAQAAAQNYEEHPNAETSSVGAVTLRPTARRSAAVEQEQNTAATETSRRRWGSGGARPGAFTPNSAALRRPDSGLRSGERSEQALIQDRPFTPQASPRPANDLAAPSTNGIVNLPTFFRLLDELTSQANKLRQAGLTDDLSIKIDLLQLIQKIQENQ